MDFPNLSKSSFTQQAQNPSGFEKLFQRRISSKPSAFRRWLKSHSDSYIYALVPKPQLLEVANGTRLNRLRLLIYISDKREIELLYPEDFFLDCYYASQYADLFENNLLDANKNRSNKKLKEAQ